MKKIIAIILGLSITFPVFALSADEVALKYEANTKFETSVAVATLVITDSLGKSTQQLKSTSRGEGDTLIEIISGPDRGQKVLRKDTSIYLFYPEAEQIIRLQGSALKDSFMGSDFSYEDLSRDNSILKNYSAKLITEDEKTYTLELTAKTRKMVYQKENLIIDKETFVCLSGTMMSASGKALRSLENSDIKKVGKYFVPFKTVMKDLLKRQGSTVMTIDSVEIDIPVNPKIFTKENLSW